MENQQSENQNGLDGSDEFRTDVHPYEQENTGAAVPFADGAEVTPQARQMPPQMQQEPQAPQTPQGSDSQQMPQGQQPPQMQQEPQAQAPQYQPQQPQQPQQQGGPYVPPYGAASSYAGQNVTGRGGFYSANAGAAGGSNAAYGGSYGGYQGSYQTYQNGAPYQAQPAPNVHSAGGEAKRQKKNREKSEKKSRGFGSLVGKAVVAALLFGVIAGGTFVGIVSLTGVTKTADGSGSSVSSSVASTDTSGVASDLTDVAAIAEEVMPSIVAITNISVTTYDSFFFGTQTQESTSLGSGIIVAQDDTYLYICTNNHVVSGAETLTVQFIDDSVVSAEITGQDSADDLAVVQVELNSIESETRSAIKVATVDDSGDVVVGEATIAIGNALGYGQSVTTGVVSAVGRTVTVSDSTTGESVTNANLIQTDAAINAGNSGGALLNASGAVIGINSAKYSGTGVEGIGYAIPMSDAYPVILAIINGEDIPQGAYLGISGQTVSTDVSAVYGVPQGVLIVEVMPNSAAEAAGLKAQDIITAMEGKAISSMDELKANLALYKEGDTVTLTVASPKDGYEPRNVTVTLGGSSGSD